MNIPSPISSEVVLSIIGVAGTPIGTFVGWWLQQWSDVTKRRAGYGEFVKFAERLMRETLIISDQFSTWEQLAGAEQFKIQYPEFLRKELIVFHKRARESDAEIAIYAMWLLQTVDNLKNAVAGFHEDVEERRKREEVSFVSETSYSVIHVIQQTKDVKAYAQCILYLCLRRKSGLDRLMVKHLPKYMPLRTAYERQEAKSSSNITMESDS